MKILHGFILFLAARLISSTDASACFRESFPESVGNANISCTSANITCTVKCKSGYIFYDGNDTKTHNCENNQWTPSLPPDSCIKYEDPSYLIKFQLVYQSVVLASSCLDGHEHILTSKNATFASELMAICNNMFVTVGEIAIYKMESTPSSFSLNTRFTIKLPDTAVAGSQKTLCDSLIENQLHRSDFLDYSESVTCHHCSNHVTRHTPSSGNRKLSSGNQCESATLKATVIGDKCVPCPPGTFSSGPDHCTECPEGKFQSNYGETECYNCPQDTLVPSSDKTKCVDCSVAGTCSQWSLWSDCSTTSGHGHQNRSRECSGICSGFTDEESSPCPVNGKWGAWDNWSSCSVTCDGGTTARQRTCDNPVPANNGSDCDGNSSETGSCSVIKCTVNGKWGAWDNWSSCSVTCDGCTTTRQRKCDNPLSANNGSDCDGNSTETGSCSVIKFTVNGKWGAWDNWSPCSITCDGGITTRQRSCDNPLPAYNGSDCDGNSTETGPCSVIKCTDFAESSIPVESIIAGTISACVVILTVAVVAVVIIHRRRQKNMEKHDYAISDTRQGEEHFYMQTGTDNDYYNTDLRSSVQEKNNKDILTEYKSPELSQMFLDKQLCAQKIQDEFQWLTKNTTHEHGADCQEVNVLVKNETVTSYDTYVNTAIVKQYDTGDVIVVTETPNKSEMEMFWELVNNLKVRDVILLVQKREKITDFFPTTDEPIEMQNLEVKMISSGRNDYDIIVYSLELTDLERKTVSEIRLHKTTNWKIGDTFPDISTMCNLIENENSASVLMMGSKGNAYRICAVLSMCLGVVKAIKDDKNISILQNAMDMVKSSPDLFQTFEEYEICYNILKHYLENEYCYAVIT